MSRLVKNEWKLGENWLYPDSENWSYPDWLKRYRFVAPSCRHTWAVDWILGGQQNKPLGEKHNEQTSLLDGIYKYHSTHISSLQCLSIKSRKTAIQPLFDVISFQFKKRRTVLTAKQITGNIFPGLIFDGRGQRQEEKEELGEEKPWRGNFWRGKGSESVALGGHLAWETWFQGEVFLKVYYEKLKSI